MLAISRPGGASGGGSGDTGAKVKGGRSPIFHDAEITEVSLHRNRPSTFLIKSPIYSADSEFTESWSIYLEINEILEIELVGFNHQNVLFDLTISQRDGLYVINIDASFGLDGFIVAREVRLKMALQNG
ncbi:MAG: hypothetical protein J0H83_09055 [Candidatus Melainabacteria bacterium]|nr:hypothetical protein [Candidatus Melainabacteria bacterium]